MSNLADQMRKTSQKAQATRLKEERAKLDAEQKEIERKGRLHFEKDLPRIEKEIKKAARKGGCSVHLQNYWKEHTWANNNLFTPWATENGFHTHGYWMQMDDDGNGENVFEICWGTGQNCRR